MVQGKRMVVDSVSKEMSIAIKAAKAAAKIHLKHLGKVSARKKSTYELVTKADLEAEKKIVEIISKAFPGHGIVGEEGTSNERKELTWFVDPLDGTNNFAHGYPMFCVSIALASESKGLLGVVLDPLRKELFTAEQGRGAKLNGKKIKVSSISKLRDCLLVSGFGYDRGAIMRKHLKVIGKVMPKIQVIRRSGSAALDLVYVAAGRVDGFWEPDLKPWDMMAGGVIVREAGGTVTDLKGNHLHETKAVVATNGLIHGKLIRLLNQKS